MGDVGEQRSAKEDHDGMKKRREDDGQERGQQTCLVVEINPERD